MTLEPKAVTALFDDWNFALSSLDPAQVVQRYWPDAVLLPTLSNTPRNSPAMINDYFVHFLAKRPRGRIDTRTIYGGCNVAMDVGTYSFSLMDDKGVTTEAAARYTFIYQYRDGSWKILHHHSSGMPESIASAVPAAAHSTADTAHAAAQPAPAAPVATPKAAPQVHAPAPAQAPPDSKEKPKPTSHASAQAAKPAETPQKETRTPLFANLASSPPPSKFYPPDAAKHKERGSVNLMVCADSAGLVVGTPEVKKSSGSKLLDEAAQTWARAAKWIPATMNQHSVEGCTQIDIAFEPLA